jgi:uncharacterized protein YggE
MSEQKLNPKFVLLSGILAAGLLGAVFLADQMVQNAEAQNSIQTDRPTVTTSGTATTSVWPDKFSVTVGVETNGTSAEEAASSNADLLTAVISALRALGISEDQISTSQYSVRPVYSHTESVNVCRVMEGYPIPPECYVDQVVIGYRAFSSVTVTLDADGGVSAGQVVDASVKAGATNVSGAYFFLSQERQREVQDGLIGHAIASAKHRADIAAQAVEMEVLGVHSISMNAVFFPVFSRAEAADTQTLPGEQEVSMSVSVTYFIQEL